MYVCTYICRHVRTYLRTYVYVHLGLHVLVHVCAKDIYSYVPIEKLIVQRFHGWRLSARIAAKHRFSHQSLQLQIRILKARHLNPVMLVGAHKHRLEAPSKYDGSSWRTEPLKTGNPQPSKYTLSFLGPKSLNFKPLSPKPWIMNP